MFVVIMIVFSIFLIRNVKYLKMQSRKIEFKNSFLGPFLKFLIEEIRLTEQHEWRIISVITMKKIWKKCDY